MVEQQRDLPPGSLDDYGRIMAGTIGEMSHEDRMEWAAKQAYIALGTLLAACAAIGARFLPNGGFYLRRVQRVARPWSQASSCGGCVADRIPG